MQYIADTERIYLPCFQTLISNTDNSQETKMSESCLFYSIKDNFKRFLCITLTVKASRHEGNVLYFSNEKKV